MVAASTFSRSSRPVIVIGAILAWFALLLQFYLIIEGRKQSIPATIVRYFSFFTILTNILCALCFTALLGGSASGWVRFFSRPKVIAAIAMNILIVGLVYNLVLRQLYVLEGLNKLTNELLHVVDPIYFIFFWIWFAPKPELQWKDILPWLLYPLCYIIFILLRGPLAGEYPYPFIDVIKLGYPVVLQNCFFLFLAFLIVSILFVGISKWLPKKRSV